MHLNERFVFLLGSNLALGITLALKAEYDQASVVTWRLRSVSCASLRFPALLTIGRPFLLGQTHTTQLQERSLRPHTPRWPVRSHHRMSLHRVLPDDAEMVLQGLHVRLEAFHNQLPPFAALGDRFRRVRTDVCIELRNGHELVDR